MPYSVPRWTPYSDGDSGETCVGTLTGSAVGVRSGTVNGSGVAVGGSVDSAGGSCSCPGVGAITVTAGAAVGGGAQAAASKPVANRARAIRVDMRLQRLLPGIDCYLWTVVPWHMTTILLYHTW